MSTATAPPSSRPRGRRRAASSRRSTWAWWVGGAGALLGAAGLRRAGDARIGPHAGAFVNLARPHAPSQVGINIPIPVPLPFFSFTGAYRLLAPPAFRNRLPPCSLPAFQPAPRHAACDFTGCRCPCCVLCCAALPPAGWRGSFHGDLQMYGKMGVQFYTRTKTVTQSWKDADAPGVIPGLAGVGEPCLGGCSSLLRLWNMPRSKLLAGERPPMAFSAMVLPYCCCHPRRCQHAGQALRCSASDVTPVSSLYLFGFACNLLLHVTKDARYLLVKRNAWRASNNSREGTDAGKKV